MVVLPGVLGSLPLRRTIQVRLGTNTLRLPGGTTIFMVSRQQFMKYPGLNSSKSELQSRCLILAEMSWSCSFYQQCFVELI